MEEYHYLNAKKAGAFDAVSSTHYARGGEGAIQLATSVIEACQMKNNFKFLYELNLPIKSKIEIIAKEIYRADSVKYEGTTEEDIENFEKNGFGNLPICIAKTQYSFSHDPKLLGTPNGFVFPIREIRASIGAGFIFPISGDISTMPGLPTRPAYYDIDIDEKGNITGLF
ncbi:monofunctional c1-tetrahydrofolate synthase [Anaeramoeba ignava]|uniref:formate--tetrahydrofolate ligase n=1 Tax=Anaeramoeba ignava TaxID=1746090 RepID=A0A9Q0L9K8_ANAIG|nr:monofunctional c1-tetrahydrofolate synthase [Anaeramoeba ignava]